MAIRRPLVTIDGRLAQMPAGDRLPVDSRYATALLDNTTATADPTVNDDSTAGYSIRSKWINTATANIFVCLDASAGAAVWRDTTLTLADLGGLAALDAVTAADIDSGTATAGQYPAADGNGGAAWADLPQPPFLGFRAYQTQSQNLPVNTGVKIVFQAIDFESPASWYDPSNGRFTPQQEGFWLIGFSARVYSPKNINVAGKIYKNGNNYKNLNNQNVVTDNVVYPGGSTVVHLNGSTDYVEYYVTSFQDSSHTTGSDSSNTSAYAAFLGLNDVFV